MTDAEWALIEPLIPPEKRPGRHREVVIREVVNAIFYLLSTGCQWRFLPKDLPPRSTVHDYFKLWEWDGRLDRIHFTLFVQVTACCTEEEAKETLFPAVDHARRTEFGRPRSSISRDNQGENGASIWMRKCRQRRAGVRA
jgi:transposase